VSFDATVYFKEVPPDLAARWEAALKELQIDLKAWVKAPAAKGAMTWYLYEKTDKKPEDGLAVYVKPSAPDAKLKPDEAKLLAGMRHAATLDANLGAGTVVLMIMGALAKATGAPVYCPKLEVPVLADIMRFVPFPGFGPFESYDADETVEGGEHLELAGLDIDVIFTPGHSPGHVTYAIDGALFSGDVLFEGSVGRTDLPGGDGETLIASIERELLPLPDDTILYSGHGPESTIGRERRTNPFLTGAYRLV